jgi:hypothetical protein
MKTYLVLVLLIHFARSTTPDCYSDQTVSKKWNGYSDVIPPELSGYRVDWFTIDAGSNCGFYTFGNVYFLSFNSSTSGIYLVYQNSTQSDGTLKCSLQSTNIN